jgi:hypothetical protein
MSPPGHSVSRFPFRESPRKKFSKKPWRSQTRTPYAIRNPLFDPVRSDPRYLEMMRGVGLSP